MITFIDTRYYDKMPIEEYDRLKDSKDDYILDAMAYKSLDGHFMYVETVEMMLKREEEDLEYYANNPV